LLRHVVWRKFADDLEVLTASIIRAMMEAASTSETSVNVYHTTWRNNLEDSHPDVGLPYTHILFKMRKFFSNFFFDIVTFFDI
jgi:hypothetical protein